MKAANWSRLRYSEALVFGFNIIDGKKLQEFQDLYTPSSTSVRKMISISKPKNRAFLTKEHDTIFILCFLFSSWFEVFSVM